MKKPIRSYRVKGGESMGYSDPSRKAEDAAVIVDDLTASAAALDRAGMVPRLSVNTSRDTLELYVWVADPPPAAPPHPTPAQLGLVADPAIAKLWDGAELCEYMPLLPTDSPADNTPALGQIRRSRR